MIVRHVLRRDARGWPRVMSAGVGGCAAPRTDGGDGERRDRLVGPEAERFLTSGRLSSRAPREWSGRTVKGDTGTHRLVREGDR